MESCGLFGFTTKGQFVMRMLIAVAIMAALLFWGSEDASRDEMVVRGAAIATIGLLFPLSYFWNFVRSPAEMSNDAERRFDAEVNTLNARLERLENERAQREAIFIEDTKRQIADKASEIREFVLFKNWNEDSVKEAFHGTSAVVNRITIHDAEFSRIWSEFRTAVDRYVQVVSKKNELAGFAAFSEQIFRAAVDDATASVAKYLRT